MNFKTWSKKLMVFGVLTVLLVPQSGLSIENKKIQIQAKTNKFDRDFFVKVSKKRKKIYKPDTSIWLKKNLENRSFGDDLSKEIPESLNLALEVVSNPDYSMAGGYHFNPNFNHKLQRIRSSKLLGSSIITAGFAKLPATLSKEEKQNILNAISKIDGQIVAPNSYFSFNDRMGEFSSENGFAKGRVLVGKEVELQFGGGACQVSSALYRALVNSGLNVTERQGHSRELSEYQPAGLDSMIYGGFQDLKFFNDFAESVYIEATFHDNNVVVLLHGKSEQEVSLVAKKSEAKEIEDQDYKIFHWRQQITSSISNSKTYSILSRYKLEDSKEAEGLVDEN